MHEQEIELAILESVDKITNQKTIAKEIGYSVGKVNYVLRSLIEKGLVKAEKFLNSKQKYNYKYLLTEEGIKEKIVLTKRFVTQKKAEYDRLQENLEKYQEQYSSLMGGGK